MPVREETGKRAGRGWRSRTAAMVGVGLVVGLAVVVTTAVPAVAEPETIAGQAEDAAAAAESAGTLVVKVILVGGDLSLRPVPKKAFLIVPAAEGAGATSVTTDFEGVIRTSLVAGAYRIRNGKPVEFEGKRFSWDVAFEIDEGAETVIELSNDNARIEDVGPPAQAPAASDALDEGTLYRRYKAGVFKIISDGGHGSGFLVSADGMVLTNHHVVSEAEYLAVKIDAEHKYAVTLLADDPKHDIAVLRLHPETVSGLPVLPLADESADEPSVAVGDDVLAIGSPLTTETILTKGLVSKVEDISIYSDVNINPGNSGGPLLDMRGRVIGINTFGLGGEGGPGLSGITRIYLAAPVIEKARKAMQSGAQPARKLLPVASSYRFAPDLVRDAALAVQPKMKDYNLDAGKIDVQIYTPVLMAYNVMRAEREAGEGRKKRRKKKDRGQDDYQPGEHFYEWTKSADNFRAVVRIRAFPEIKMKAGSAWKVALLGGRANYRFKTDFERMTLFRGGKPVEPIHPGRIKEVVHVDGAAVMKDVGFYGYYEFTPEAFEPGEALTLHVWEQGKPEPTVLSLSDELVARIWKDFAAYIAAGK